ncbi:MAG: PEP-CTERM sorting domain-containing protein [bacterium]|nr:PEP-CTERM sorting domain-containing protein [bacterium]
MKNLLAVAVLTLMLGLLTVPAHANLLTNAGFENAEQGAWWGPWGTNQHVGTYGNAGTGIDGSKSVKFVSNSNTGTGDDYFMYDNTLVSVVSGTTYYGSIFVKTENLINEEVTVKIDWFNSGSWVGTVGASAPLSGTNDWTMLDISGIAPLNATHASLAFFINQTVDGGTGTAYFDNAYLDANPVPEPGTIVLLTGGLLGLIAFSRKKNK